MIRNLYKQQVDALGKMLTIILSQFLSKKEGFDFNEFELKVQENDDLKELYLDNDLQKFTQSIENFRAENELLLQLISFFYKLYCLNHKNLVYKEKCLLIFNYLDAVSLDALSIYTELNN